MAAESVSQQNEDGAKEQQGKIAGYMGTEKYISPVTDQEGQKPLDDVETCRQSQKDPVVADYQGAALPCGKQQQKSAGQVVEEAVG